MLQKHARFIAIMMMLMLLASVIVVPIGHAVRVPGWLLPLWIAYTVLEDILSGIDRLIGIITQDIEEMEEALEETNDELLNKWYPKRENKEAELRDAQGKLDDLNAEHEAALTKKRNANSRIRTLKSEISQIEASLAMLSPSEESQRAALEAQLAQKKSELADAKQDVKEADKIINSHWRAAKRSWYRYIIGDAFSGLTGELVRINARINTLETSVDNLNRDIENKNTEKENQTKRREQKQREVDEARRNYENARQNGNPNTQN